MPKKCIKFISGFLIPSLDKEKFGRHLRWIDKTRNMFQMDWCHRKGSSWTEQGAEIFVEWDKHKGHFQPDDKDYLSKSKQRFRSLLNKFKTTGHLEELKHGDRYKKIFCIVKRDHGRRNRNSDEFRTGYELYNEGILFSDDKVEEDDDLLPDDMYRRKISKDNTINILEDHTYSSNLQYDHTENENSQIVQDNFIEMTGSRVLVEKNSVLQEHFTSIPNNVNELQGPWDIFMNDDIYFETENINTSRSSENLQGDFDLPHFTPVCPNKISEGNPVLTENVKFDSNFYNSNPELCDLADVIGPMC